MEKSLAPSLNWSTFSTVTSHQGHSSPRRSAAQGQTITVKKMVDGAGSAEEQEENVTMDFLEDQDFSWLAAAGLDHGQMEMGSDRGQMEMGSDLKMSGPGTVYSPATALRSPHNRSGLFDREFTDRDFLEEFTSVTNFINNQSESTTSLTTHSDEAIVAGGIDLVTSPGIQSDLCSLLGDLETPTIAKTAALSADDLFSSILGIEKFGSSEEVVDLLADPESPFDLEGGMAFGEEFTDLSQLTSAILGADAIIALQEEVNESEQQADLSIYQAVPETTPEPSTSTAETPTAKNTTAGGRRSKKRKANVKCEAVPSGEPVPTVVNHDHDDYTIKASKRPRLSLPSTSSIATEDDDVSDCESMSSSASESLTKATPKAKYKERRVKNNIASRRSRQTRKQKYNEMEDRMEHLETDNVRLAEKIELMEKLAKSLKEHLVKRMSGK